MSYVIFQQNNTYQRNYQFDRTTYCINQNNRNCESKRNTFSDIHNTRNFISSNTYGSNDQHKLEALIENTLQKNCTQQMSKIVEQLKPTLNNESKELSLSFHPKTAHSCEIPTALSTTNKVSSDLNKNLDYELNYILFEYSRVHWQVIRS
jgi:hypothetical protein